MLSFFLLLNKEYADRQRQSAKQQAGRTFISAAQKSRFLDEMPMTGFQDSESEEESESEEAEESESEEEIQHAEESESESQSASQSGKGGSVLSRRRQPEERQQSLAKKRKLLP